MGQLAEVDRRVKANVRAVLFGNDTWVWVREANHGQKQVEWGIADFVNAWQRRRWVVEAKRVREVGAKSMQNRRVGLGKRLHSTPFFKFQTFLLGTIKFRHQFQFSFSYFQHFETVVPVQKSTINFKFFEALKLRNTFNFIVGTLSGGEQ